MSKNGFMIEGGPAVHSSGVTFIEIINFDLLPGIVAHQLHGDPEAVPRGWLRVLWVRPGHLLFHGGAPARLRYQLYQSGRRGRGGGLTRRGGEDGGRGA